MPLALAVACSLLFALPAQAHVERASYWPDSEAEMVDGVPAGGAVPEPRDLFTALNETAVSETRVVCPTGVALEPPEPAGAPPIRRPHRQVNGRLDQQVNREEVDRLERKLERLRDRLESAKKKAKNGKGKKGRKRKLKRKIRRVTERLNDAIAVYNQAVEAEEQASQQGGAAYQRALAEERAARARAEQDYQDALAAYEQDQADFEQAQEDYEQALDDDPSMERLDESLASAVAGGYEIRPSEPRVQVTQEEADQLRDFNASLLEECEYNEIQLAVNDSDNNDRVVVMPGIYTEPTSRAVPSNPPPEVDPCEGLEEVNDTGSPNALSYRYQFHCPNDQNLIAVMGRAPDKDASPNGDANGEEVPPSPEPDDPRRDGIPDADGLPDGGGNCIRCNLQLEGSGVSPDDVVVDSGRVESGNGAPLGSVKDVGIRADRADGFVLRNMTVRHSREHDIYSPETDGMLLEDFKTYFNGHYGVLTFVAEHHLIQDCDAAGSGDAAIYPGSSAEYGEQVDPDFQPNDPTVPHSEYEEFSTEIRRCDMRHSNTGYSGTAANSVFIHDNDFYDNAMGLVSDVFTASGHPGFPTDSSLIEDNEFYDNNFNPYLPACDSAGGEQPGPNGPGQNCSDVVPRIPAPVGTAIFLPGVNNFTIRSNRMWDNWRRGIMLFSVPDQFVCGPAAGDNEQHGCDESRVPPSTSHRNEFYDNVMGRAPDGTPMRNGDGNVAEGRTDFWWDQYLGNARNCWYGNVGPDNTRGSLTSTPPLNPAGDDAPNNVPPGAFLPGKGAFGDCRDSIGTFSVQESELLNCLGDLEFDTGTCPWYTTPPDPTP